MLALQAQLALDLPEVHIVSRVPDSLDATSAPGPLHADAEIASSLDAISDHLVDALDEDHLARLLVRSARWAARFMAVVDWESAGVAAAMWALGRTSDTLRFVSRYTPTPDDPRWGPATVTQLRRLQGEAERSIAAQLNNLNSLSVDPTASNLLIETKRQLGALRLGREAQVGEDIHGRVAYLRDMWWTGKDRTL